ncbi:MAG TPA: nuclear transport factor 2 family protein [Ktedonobacterales bacterium]|nr:nuclear transport factor 2 family protein [Ktedonobacterales bacterium]
MPQTHPIEIVNAWVAAANAQDIERLVALSDEEIEVGGPRGSGRGSQLLRDWMGRAGLTLETLRTFARGDTVVLEQRGVWRSLETGEVTGERKLASLFQTGSQRVVKFARYDDLGEALSAGGLSAADET